MTQVGRITLIVFQRALDPQTLQPFSNQASATEPSSPIDWGEFCEAGFSADVTREWDCEAVYTSNHCDGVAVMNIMMKPFMTQSLKISVILHSFVRTLNWCKGIMSFREFRVTALFLVVPHRDQLSGTHPAAVDQLTVGQLLYSSDCMVTGWGLDDANFQRQMLNMENMLQHVAHFSSEFLRTNTTTVSMVKSPRKHTLRKYSPSINGIFLVFSNQNEKHGCTFMT